MPEPIDTVVLEIPARIADLAFRISVPRDWTSHEIPAEDVDFSAPAAFVPLVLVAAPWAAVVLTVAARPGFEDGTLQDWSLFLLSSQEIRPTAFGPMTIGNVQGLAGVGRQQQEDTWLEVRFAFFEDGGRLVYLGLLAPEAISAPLEAVWQSALQGFALESPQGATVPLGPGMGIVPPPVAQAAPEAPEVEAPAEAPVEVPEPAASPESATPPTRQFTDEDLGYYAKSDDLATLDPEHPVNARLRDQAVGFVPNLLDSDLEAKTAKLGAGAIQAMIRVALGWHVNDDGRRTLLLDPDGKIQISLHLLAKEGRTMDQILDGLQQDAEQSYVGPAFLRMEKDGMWGLAVRNIVLNEEPIEQVHLLTAWAEDSAVLRARVTSDPASMRFAADYADLILRSAEYGHREGPQEAHDAPAAGLEPAKNDASEGESLTEYMKRLGHSRREVTTTAAERSAGGQAWWKAEQLEREDRLEEAERLLRDKIPNIHCAIQIAELYRLRWIRLSEEDAAKAAEARLKAAEWARTYASWATSGGEGAALSIERDEFLKLLGPETL